MFRLRPDQVESLRGSMRRRLPAQIEEKLRAEGKDVRREPGTGDLILRDRRGFDTRMQFRPDGLPRAIRQPSGLTTGYAFDGQSRLQTIALPNGDRLEFERDRAGRTVAVQRPSLDRHAFEYDDEDRVTRVGYPDGTETRFAYDGGGRILSQTDRLGAVTRWQRDARGLLQAIEDPLGRRTVYRTDGDDRLREVAYPDGTSEGYGYDPETATGLLRLRDGSEARLSLTPDQKLRDVRWRDGSWVSFETDPRGLVVVVENAAARVVNRWTEDGLPEAEETPRGVVEFERDAEGLLTRLVLPNGDAIEYGWDEDGRPVLVRDWEGREIRYDWSALGQLSQVTHGNGMVERLRYGRLGRATGAELVDSEGRLLGRQAYEYDLCERLTKVADIWGPDETDRLSRKLRHDPEGRILQEWDVIGQRSLEAFHYDAKGNLVAAADGASAIGPMDEPRSAGGSRIEYDARGNIRELPGTRGTLTCAFGDDQTLREVRVAGETWRYRYDGLGRRIGKTNGTEEWRYGWAGTMLLWEEHVEAPGAAPRRRDYLYTPDGLTPLAFREAGRTCWLQTDARGAVICAVDEGGQIVWRATYDSFGRATIKVGRVRQPWRLVGHYFDEESGLHYNFARYYSPQIRSYLSRDPSWHLPGATNYSYARNDPWNRADPFGTFAPLLIIGGAMLVGAVVGAVSAWATGGDPVAGAVEGGIGALGMVVGGMLGGPVGAKVGSVIGSAAGAFASDMVERLRKGEPICVECALKRAGTAAAIDAAFVVGAPMVGKLIPKSVTRQVGRLGGKVSKLARHAVPRSVRRVMRPRVTPAAGKSAKLKLQPKWRQDLTAMRKSASAVDRSNASRAYRARQAMMRDLKKDMLAENRALPSSSKMPAKKINLRAREIADSYDWARYREIGKVDLKKGTPLGKVVDGPGYKYSGSPFFQPGTDPASLNPRALQRGLALPPQNSATHFQQFTTTRPVSGWQGPTTGGTWLTKTGGRFVPGVTRPGRGIQTTIGSVRPPVRASGPPSSIGGGVMRDVAVGTSTESVAGKLIGGDD